MIKITKFIFFVMLLSFVSRADASIAPQYLNLASYNHELSRAEQRCLDEGFKFTHINCPKFTAPTDQCPHHINYYRNCSQEQWCKNNNYTLQESDCQEPFYPFKMCANQFPLYRICREDIASSCTKKGFVHKSSCQLNDKRCPYSKDYGLCCDSCPKFSHDLQNIPEGFIATGETCTTCEGIVKTNIKPAPCDNFMPCEYGPLSAQTPHCLHGNLTYYSACKTSADVCQEKGFKVFSCSATEDIAACPENNNYKRCSINCLKQSSADNADADVIAQDLTDPVLDVTKNKLMSLVDSPIASCKTNTRPLLTIHINQKNLEIYKHLFNRDIKNVNFMLIFDEAVSLSANGNLENVKISAKGKIPTCALLGQNMQISGIVSLNGIDNICTNIKINANSKFLTDGNIKGNLSLERDSSLGVKGNVLGYIKAKSYTEVFIKGELQYKDEFNTTPDVESIVFGCNSKVKIGKGIISNTSSIFLKQWVSLDTPFIKLLSFSSDPNLHNELSSIHLYKYSKIFNAYGDTVFPMTENNVTSCDDRYYTHLGSAKNTLLQTFSLEPSNLLDEKLWKCRKLDHKHLQCE